MQRKLSYITFTYGFKMFLSVTLDLTYSVDVYSLKTNYKSDDEIFEILFHSTVFPCRGYSPIIWFFVYAYISLTILIVSKVNLDERMEVKTQSKQKTKIAL